MLAISPRDSAVAAAPIQAYMKPQTSLGGPPLSIAVEFCFVLRFMLS